MLSCKETTEEEEAAVLLQSKLAQKISHCSQEKDFDLKLLCCLHEFSALLQRSISQFVYKG